jgi:hypothetical protein
MCCGRADAPQPDRGEDLPPYLEDLDLKKDKGEKFCRIPQLRRNANELRDMFLRIEDGASDGCVQREASVSR